MASNSVKIPATALYEEDFIAWTERMATLLENHDSADLDWDHLAEEIRDLGISQKYALKSHLENVLSHVIKWEIQKERRSRSWEQSISNSRGAVDSLLDSIPSLRSYLAETFERSYARAYRRAISETRLPERTPYTRWTVEQVLDPGFLPE